MLHWPGRQAPRRRAGEHAVGGLEAGRVGIVRDRRLIGRADELAELASAINRARAGDGRLLLLAGEAGVGKTRLAEEALAHSELCVLRGGTNQGVTPPYGPIVAALRSALRAAPDDLATGSELFAGAGPLAGHLALLLPELGTPPEHSDRSTLFEAIGNAFAGLARRRPTALFLDDLQWADATTLELLTELAGRCEREPLLIVGAYRSDEIPRDHPLRRLRTDLRRAGRGREIAIAPLTPDETAALAAGIFGQPPSLALAAALYQRSQGVAFFVEELAATLAASGRLEAGATQVELVGGEQVPLPETVRDAVLLRAEGLSDAARSALELAAVFGMWFDLDAIAELTGAEGVLEAHLERGLVVETEPGQAAFRHALTREALYAELPWSRRRALHRQIAAHLERRGRPASEIAEHWLAARDNEAGRQALLVAADASSRVHAYRDAARAARRALELWPDGIDEAGRLAALDQLGRCAELCGDLVEAGRVWREVAAAHQAAGRWLELAETQRHLAMVFELRGAGESALAARQAAAEAFEAGGLPGEAAAERIAVAEHLNAASRFSAALELVVTAASEAATAGRADLQARALGLEGELRAALDQPEAGLRAIQAGLELALERDLAGPAAEVYYRLGVALDYASDYTASRGAYQAAIGFCQERGISELTQVCLGCLAVVLRQTGEWDQAVSQCREVLAATEAPPAARAIAAGVLGSLQALRGERARARGLLLEANTQARGLGLVPLELDTTWGLGLVDELEGANDAAAERCRLVLGRWEGTEERHHAILPLRWATTFLAGRGLEADARACARALATIAASGNPEALAGLAHALGECALLDGDAVQAVGHFGRALEQLGRLETPFARAETGLRAGVALAAAQEKQAAVERLTEAYRIARKLGARPLATRAARELTALGERVEQRLGRRAAGYLERGGLSRRELEVLRLVSQGQTNREIGRELFLSPRTVETYVGNILTKLDCASRTEATRKASELQLLARK